MKNFYCTCSIFNFSIFFILLLYQILSFLTFLIIDLTLTFPFFLLREHNVNITNFFRSLTAHDLIFFAPHQLLSLQACFCLLFCFVWSNPSNYNASPLHLCTIRNFIHRVSVHTHTLYLLSEISFQLNQLIDAVSFVLLIVKWLHRGGTNSTMPGSSVTFIPWSLISVFTRSTSSGAGFEKSMLECRLREIEDWKK